MEYILFNHDFLGEGDPKRDFSSNKKNYTK